MKKKKYNNGGQLLQQLLPSALSLIPGGNLLSPFLTMAMQNNSQPKAYTPQPAMGTNPFGKLFNGGPILPVAQESTYVQPRPLQKRPIDIVDVDMIQQQNYQMRDTNAYNPFTGLGKYDKFGGSGKVKSKDRFREKAMGGQINDGFVQYDSGSHNSGNDTQIDQFGNPTSNGVASIQNKENMYNGFVLSDTLINPETGNKFNIDAMKINKKYKNARLSDVDKNSLDFEMGRLQALNQEKINKESKQMAYGGRIKPPTFNDDPMDAYNQSVQLEDPNYAFGQANELIGQARIKPFNPLPTPLQSRSNSTLNLPTFENSTTNMVTGNPAGSTVTPRGMGALDAVGLGFKGLALAGSINDALTPAEVENPILPDYQKSDQYMQSANIDYSQAKQDSLGVSNQQSNAIRSMSGNAGQYMSRQTGRLAQLQDAISRIGMQENNAQSQLNLQKGQYEQNKALDTTNRLYQNRVDNLQNAAVTRSFDRSLASDFSQIGTQFGEEVRAQEAIANNRDLTNFTNTQIISALNSKYGNFQVSEDIIEQFKQGKININDLLKFKS